MSAEKLTFSQDVPFEQWCALPRDMKKGDVVYRFRGHTYGLDRDDMMAGTETIPCTLEQGDESFFTVPVEYLQYEDGKKPMGAYVRIGS